MAGTLLIRADAGIASGMGHGMRCLAIAQAWQDAGGDCVFALNEIAALEQRLCSERMTVSPIDAPAGSQQDLAQLVKLARVNNASWVVVDGYVFNGEYQFALKQAGLNVLFLDDFGHAGHYFADIVLNQNPQASPTFYTQRETYTRLLLGPTYALLRREFRSPRTSSREVPPLARKLLLTMGGCDADNVTARVIEALPLIQVAGLETKVVVGGGNPHHESLRQLADDFNGNLSLIDSTPRMPELMAWADLAISAGGGTCYELAFLEVPMFVITIAKNHERTCQILAERGAAVDAGWFHSLDSDQLAKSLQSLISDQRQRGFLAENACRLVDGNGAARVVASMITSPDPLNGRAAASEMS